MTAAVQPSELSSRVVQEVINTLAAGRHAMLCGRMDELVLYRGSAMSLMQALERIGRTFQVVARMDAADGFTVLQGEDIWTPDDDHHRDAIEQVRALLEQDAHTALVILDQADILLQEPATHDQLDRRRAAVLARGLSAARTNGRFRNTAIFLARTPAEIPEVVRAGAERVAIVEVPLPSSVERSAFLATALTPDVPGFSKLGQDGRVELLRTLTRLTDNLALRDLEAFVCYASTTKLDVADARTLLRRFRFGESPDQWGAVLANLPSIDAGLRRQVIGQDAAADAVIAGLAGAALGLCMNGDPFSLEAQPRVVLLMLGPTGVGKTEMAKALAEILFGDPTAYTRFDMGLFGQEHSVDRFVGSPPGYVAHEQGGELTESVRRRPQQVLLFDEIEKAHWRVWDALMSVIDDGRVTDAQGRVTYFSETILLLTGNLGASRLHDAALAGAVPESAPAADLSSLDPAQVEEVFRSAAADYFRHDINRPEILGRMERSIVVFQPLRVPQIAGIVHKIITATSFAQGPTLVVDEASAVRFAERVLADPAAAALGGRHIRNSLRSAFTRLAAWTVLNGHGSAVRLDVEFGLDGSLRVSVDGGAPQEVLI